LADPGAGLVNCFYCLANPATPAMQWEAVAINADFWTQVLQARSLKPVDFALGAVMTLPAAQLKSIGGFAALADYLADDYQLGRHLARQQKRIEFATVVAECWEAPMNWRQVWAHQSRWARTIRVCQPGPFF
jgi:ceramide glucosyltransferase